ncbi:RNA polymerase II mediator complex subunit [Xylographa soralifera]|nr:RNA polymerase II mediator complex subunit [Xylographa soralifera]
MATLSVFSQDWSSTRNATLVLSFAVAFAYPAVTALYNLYFHPLAKFPGPKLWSASRIPYIVSLLRGNLVHDQQKIHEQYGDVVRLGPDEISFATDEAWRDIYVHRPGHKDLTKDPIWYKAPDEMPQNIITTTDLTVHTRLRKLMGSAFTEHSLRNQQPLIESYADLVVTKLHKLVAEPATGDNTATTNILDWLNYFTIDVMGDLAFGESFDCLQNSDYHPWIKTLHSFLKGMVYLAATRFYPSVEYVFFKMLPKSVMDMQRKHAEFANEKIRRRLNVEMKRPDFMTPFMENNIGFEKLSIREIESNFAILIVAGTDATATTLSGTINYLVLNPEVLERLTNEIRTSFKRESDITIAAAQNLAYLNAVINEGLRLCNPVPGGLPRIVPTGGDIYAGHWIPENTSISVRPYVISRSEAYFSQPDSFIPSRWLPLDQRPAEFKSDHLTASNPFSIGHSNCLGERLAWAEMRIFLARLLWAFDIAEGGGKRLDWKMLKTLMIVQKQPVEIRLKLRKE